MGGREAFRSLLWSVLFKGRSVLFTVEEKTSLTGEKAFERFLTGPRIFMG